MIELFRITNLKLRHTKTVPEFVKRSLTVNNCIFATMQKILVIQTAFIGDVVLATAVVEKLQSRYPSASIDFLLRKGNEGLLANHPFINEVLIWDKQSNKTVNLFKIVNKVRKKGYTHIINLHRFASSGFITFLSGAAYKAGFDKNPFSFCYTKKVKHIISTPYSPQPIHETQRNQNVIADLTDDVALLPKLYPTAKDYEKVLPYQTDSYICIAPSSVWFTKQFPVSKWIDLVHKLPADYTLYLLGGKGDTALANEIIRASTHKKIVSLCGELNFLASAALMEGAKMNYVNDSAPLHFATSVNAPATAIYCSTVPAFGFWPLQENGQYVEVEEKLSCRPCGLHGQKACPEGHFNCAMNIKTEQLLSWTLNKK